MSGVTLGIFRRGNKLKIPKVGSGPGTIDKKKLLFWKRTPYSLLNGC